LTARPLSEVEGPQAAVERGESTLADVVGRRERPPGAPECRGHGVQRGHADAPGEQHNRPVFMVRLEVVPWSGHLKRGTNGQTVDCQ
jgi:hypothetical protein